MEFYFAPLEGVTNYILRNAHKRHFGTLDKYFAPFIVADQNEGFKSKDRNDLLPEHNLGLSLVPQILTSRPEDFNYTLKKIESFGYESFNLNLGCPSGTVVSKKRGSGVLADLDQLRFLLEGIFNVHTAQISIKTRIGIDDPEAFYQILQIYNEYPLHELIIHPRLQKDMYKNKPNLDMFGHAMATSKHSLCYNGDIFTMWDYQQIVTKFPQLEKVMLGRGLLMNPGLLMTIQTGEKASKASLLAYHDEIKAGYQAILSGDTNLLFKMKELWHYLQHSFENPEKHMKKIKKAVTLTDYQTAVNRIFEDLDLIK